MARLPRRGPRLAAGLTDPPRRACSCLSDCEGGPECLDDEGGPLPAVALEPDDLPGRPLTVDKVGPLLAKEIG